MTSAIEQRAEDCGITITGVDSHMDALEWAVRMFHKMVHEPQICGCRTEVYPPTGACAECVDGWLELLITQFAAFEELEFGRGLRKSRLKRLAELRAETDRIKRQIWPTEQLAAPVNAARLTARPAP